MKIALRAGLGFGFVALIVFALGVFALTRISAMESEAEEIDQRLLPTIQLLGQANQEFLRIRAGTLRLLISDQQEQRSGVDGLSKLRQTLAQERQDLDRLIHDSEGKALLATFDQSLARYETFQRQIIDLALQGRTDEAIALTRGELNEHARVTSDTLRDLIDLKRKAADSASDRSIEVAASAFQGVVVAMVLAVIATIVLAMLLTRSIVQPLAEAVGVAEVIAGGDLTRSIKVVGNDEPARLLIALQAMQRSLRDTIQGISHSSNQLASAAEELNVVTEDSTRGLHQQNHEIEQAATAVNEMTTAVDEVARNAVATSEASRESDETAQHGRQQVIRTVESIGLLANDVTQTATEVERLAGQVRDISKVLDVIRSIAEQTNLLALNAAIEAARAGDAGRGFAVVADEVRALAHRTQQSTQEIEQMIGDVHQGTDKAVHAMQLSNERARTTLDLARAAGEALDGIASAISQISERNLVIASASEEQAQVAREVDRNLVNIRDLSLQSSAGANQTSAASQELARLAIDLNNLVARFQV
ncbi:methyl-accepting chemotaxis protein [Stutzerimonas stutzeri]|uniref:methyl-accepting chemotaxis protein n=1 Tax=Stutzerimonas stutzeri TaxID=316 RepID=UPI000F78D762|nr:methyl-accepting chemotaxis protein [Stutzerimonas stutzeri]MBA1227257.1 methyl-accepting chemotaxis protein [Stutzerimonas stutzeri]NIM31551.1 HAMP domain-containing protein [Stutzerimonas stutzeri]NIM55563.1 HAMP domain-containing protein [Stutzerimonas stutzeri]NIM87000.1 HAMP domain-containing protein [Stutzerimonas stutzeri]NIN81660.1 HAMP domain-containing protein [Stutzerimonas stutzeri]